MITKLIGFLILSGALASIYLFENSTIASGPFKIFHWPAIFLTGIGPIGLLLLCSDWQRFKEVFQLLISKSPSECRRIHDSEGELLQNLTQKYYFQGPKALEDVDSKNISPSLHRVLRRLSIKMPVHDVRSLFERERDKTESRYIQSINLLSLGVRLAPSIGMLGTILGMVQLLASLNDPTHIGSHMSLALLTTFYGLFFSLAVWTPFQQRLQSTLDVELTSFDQILHWLKLLEERKPPQYLHDDPFDQQIIKSKVQPTHARAEL